MNRAPEKLSSGENCWEFLLVDKITYYFRLRYVISRWGLKTELILWLFTERWRETSRYQLQSNGCFILFKQSIQSRLLYSIVFVFLILPFLQCCGHERQNARRSLSANFHGLRKIKNTTTCTNPTRNETKFKIFKDCQLCYSFRSWAVSPNDMNILKIKSRRSHLTIKIFEGLSLMQLKKKFQILYTNFNDFISFVGFINFQHIHEHVQQVISRVYHHIPFQF